MKAEASIQLLKFCFQVLNCILLVSGSWDTSRRPSRSQRGEQMMACLCPLSPLRLCLCLSPSRFWVSVFSRVLCGSCSALQTS